MRAAAFSSPPFLVSITTMDLEGSVAGPVTGRRAAPTGGTLVVFRTVSQVTEPCRMFPRGSREVTGVLRSYESTRCPSWPANSFMVSVTDPGGARACVLTSFRVNST
ncbi:hypothetical protein F8R89_27905 [Streptomyces sp. SS1-1]|nr:hypothetical protein F8R89_27905 [Streptomyces sp. SS1-1]